MAHAIPKALIDQYDWYPSPITEFMQQAMIPVSADMTLCVEVGGNPQHPALILVMGLGSQMIFWPDGLIRRLIDAGFYVIRFDNRDIGLSTKVATKDLPPFKVLPAMLNMQVGLDNSHYKVAYNLSHLADDVAQLIIALKLRQAHVLGASMGGIIAQILAAKYPHLVNRLALIFSTNNRPFLPPPYPKQLQTLLKKPPTQIKEDIVNHGKWFVNTVGSQGYINSDELNRISRLRYDRCYYPIGTVQQLKAILASGSVVDYSRHIAAPTLVLHGTKDRLLPQAHGKALAKDIPNAKFVPIKGMAHDLPHYFHPFITTQLAKHMLMD